MSRGPLKCSVKGGAFVEPCTGLLGIMTEHRPRSRAKGVSKVTLTNLQTFKPSRSYVVAKLGEHQKNGIVLNFCPFCGERIDEMCGNAYDLLNQIRGVR